MNHNEYQQRKNELCEQGLMTIDMLFGAVNVLRSQLKLSPYKNSNNLWGVLRHLGFKPDVVLQSTNRWGSPHWYKPEPILIKLCTVYYNQKPVRNFRREDYVTAEEIQSGEWQPLYLCQIKTGLKKQTILDFAKQLVPWRINPENNKRLYHLPSLYELSCWRECTALKCQHKHDFVECLKTTRKTKKIGDRLWVYAPELTFLPEPDNEQTEL